MTQMRLDARQGFETASRWLATPSEDIATRAVHAAEYETVSKLYEGFKATAEGAAAVAARTANSSADLIFDEE